MLHVMLQDHRTFGPGEEDFKVFTTYGHHGHLGHVTLSWPSWSCDFDHLYKLSFPPPIEAPY